MRGAEKLQSTHPDSVTLMAEHDRCGIFPSQPGAPLLRFTAQANDFAHQASDIENVHADIHKDEFFLVAKEG